jgi:hypothetical protein
MHPVKQYRPTIHARPDQLKWKKAAMAPTCISKRKAKVSQLILARLNFGGLK